MKEARQKARFLHCATDCVNGNVSISIDIILGSGEWHSICSL